MVEVGVIMGSKSDLPVMKDAIDVLNKFGLKHEVKVVSAHRTPKQMFTYATEAKHRGIKVLIAAAGGAAHLPGMVASLTTLPVIGVPIKTSTLNGIDSLHSIVQMPTGVPVATVAINGAKNAAILAVQILAISMPNLSDQLEEFKKELVGLVDEMNQSLED
jgi:5-(carboxyamino)imidazole ribonucleotide mutase